MKLSMNMNQQSSSRARGGWKSKEESHLEVRERKEKSEHQEEAAHTIEDHTAAKLIWMEAVSTCVLKQELEQQAASRTSKQLCTICSHCYGSECDCQ